MAYLERNILPKFQERLDLAASELNDMEDIFVEAINELAGRQFIITNLISDPEERAKYATEQNYKIVDTISSIITRQDTLEQTLADIQTQITETTQEFDDKYMELEARLNALDDAAARKQDLNALWYRTGRE